MHAMHSLPLGSIITNQVSGTAYRVHADLGQGGFGAAYGAFHIDEDGHEYGDPVCLKLTEDPHAWHGEAFFGGLLSHSANVVRQRDAFPTSLVVGHHQELAFVIEMDYIATGTVADGCMDGRLPWPEDRVARKIRGLLQPLGQLHAMGASHRDIKPDNVFIGNRAVLKLGDFGISRVGLRKRGGRIEALTPAFSPKELIAFWHPADDVYQVGLLAMTLLTGTQVTNDVKKVDVNQMTSRDFGLRDAIKAAIGPKSARPQSAEALRSIIPHRK